MSNVLQKRHQIFDCLVRIHGGFTFDDLKKEFTEPIWLNRYDDFHKRITYEAFEKIFIKHEIEHCYRQRQYYHNVDETDLYSLVDKRNMHNELYNALFMTLSKHLHKVVQHVCLSVLLILFECFLLCEVDLRNGWLLNGVERGSQRTPFFLSHSRWSFMDHVHQDFIEELKYGRSVGLISLFKEIYGETKQWQEYEIVLRDTLQHVPDKIIKYDLCVYSPPWKLIARRTAIARSMEFEYKGGPVSKQELQDLLESDIIQYCCFNCFNEEDDSGNDENLRNSFLRNALGNLWRYDDEPNDGEWYDEREKKLMALKKMKMQKIMEEYSLTFLKDHAEWMRNLQQTCRRNRAKHALKGALLCASTSNFCRVNLSSWLWFNVCEHLFHIMCQEMHDVKLDYNMDLE